MSGAETTLFCKLGLRGGDAADSTPVFLSYIVDHSIMLFLCFSNYLEFGLIIPVYSSLEGTTTVVSDQGARKVLYQKVCDASF